MSTLKTFYIRDEKRNPMGCVVYEVKPGEVVFSISIRHLDDNLDKKFGRAIALQRMMQGKAITLGYCNKISGPKAQIMRFIADEHFRSTNHGPIYPKRIVNGARRWIAAKPATQSS